MAEPIVPLLSVELSDGFDGGMGGGGGKYVTHLRHNNIGFSIFFVGNKKMLKIL